MGIFELISKQLFGICGKMKEEPEIVDGVLLSEAQNPMEEHVDESVDTGILSGFEQMLIESGKKPRTIKEYIYALNSFGKLEELDEIGRETLEARLSEMKPATAQMRLAALNSFAKWRCREGYHSLWITLAIIDR